MTIMLDVAREFGYRIASFHHATEAYKIRDLLAENGVCASMWADWWGSKIEAYDGIKQNVALVDEAGGCAIVHSDSEEGIQRLNQEAAKAMQAGRNALLLRLAAPPSLGDRDPTRLISELPPSSPGVDSPDEHATGPAEAAPHGTPSFPSVRQEQVGAGLDRRSWTSIARLPSHVFVSAHAGHHT